jgi:2-polyprenyl-6-hydroxyphenyl methylase/3-demethylubiquinone-9 3-methyltransferase
MAFVKSPMNVDDKELKKFEKVADLWWDREGEFKPLHDINPLRLGYVRRRTSLSGARVLDVGCGGGILSEALAAEGARVTGIDMGEAPLRVARLHMEKTGRRIDYRRTTVERLAAAEPSSFDVVTCMELLEHVPRPASIVRACSRLVKPGGDVFFATINRNFKSFVFAVIGAEYVLRLLARGTHRFRMFVKPAELARWAEGEGLAVRDLTGMQYNPFTRRYFLGRDATVNYLMHVRRAG